MTRRSQTTQREFMRRFLLTLSSTGREFRSQEAKKPNRSRLRFLASWLLNSTAWRSASLPVCAHRDSSQVQGVICRSLLIGLCLVSTAVLGGAEEIPLGRYDQVEIATTKTSIYV